MNIFSQLNSQWAHLPIGGTSFKIGRWGCTVTSLCMVLSKLHPEGFPTPPEAAKKWSFTSDGKIIWTLSDFGGMKFAWRGYGNDAKKIKEYAGSDEKGVIVEVNNSHWLACEGVQDGKIVFCDPIDGTRNVGLPKKYTITGYAIFEKILQNMPVSEYAKEAVQKCIKSGVATGWDNPQHFVANSEVEIMLVRAGVFNKDRKLRGGVSKEDFAVALDRMELFNKII